MYIESLIKSSRGISLSNGKWKNSIVLYAPKSPNIQDTACQNSPHKYNPHKQMKAAPCNQKKKRRIRPRNYNNKKCCHESQVRARQKEQLSSRRARRTTPAIPRAP